jgi:hypothetical protein
MGRGPLELRSIVDRPPLLAGGAPRSSAYGRSGLEATSQGHTRGGGGRVAPGQLDEPFTGARVAVIESSWWGCAPVQEGRQGGWCGVK